MELFIKETESTPLVKVENGQLNIIGEIRPEFSKSFFEPVIDFAKTASNEELKVICDISFISSSSILQLKKMFIAMNENQNMRFTCVIWKYDSQDDEMLEIGQYLQELSSLVFEYVEK